MKLLTGILKHLSSNYTDTNIWITVGHVYLTLPVQSVKRTFVGSVSLSQEHTATPKLLNAAIPRMVIKDQTDPLQNHIHLFETRCKTHKTRSHHLQQNAFWNKRNSACSCICQKSKLSIGNSVKMVIRFFSNDDILDLFRLKA